MIRNLFALNKILNKNGSQLIKFSPQLLAIQQKRYFRIETDKKTLTVEEVGSNQIFSCINLKKFSQSK